MTSDKLPEFKNNEPSPETGNQDTIKTPDNKQLLEQFASFENISNLPFSSEFDSNIPGPTLVIGSAIHGNEPAGVEASLKLLEHLNQGKSQLSRGKLVFILGNPNAFAKNERYLEQNLNRLFNPNNPPKNSSVEYLRALEIMDYIGNIRNNLRGIYDLHSVSIGDFTVLIREKNRRECETANSLPKSFKFHFHYENAHLDGIFSDLAPLMGQTGLSFELGNHSSSAASHRALNYLLLTLQKNGMEIVGEPIDFEKDHTPINSDMFHYETIAKIVPSEGFKWAVEPSTNLALKKGEIYAISDSKEYVAPQDCYLVMPTPSPRADDADAGFLCIKEE